MRKESERERGACCGLFKYIFPSLFDLLHPLSVEIEINANLMVVWLWRVGRMAEATRELREMKDLFRTEHQLMQREYEFPPVGD